MRWFKSRATKQRERQERQEDQRVLLIQRRTKMEEDIRRLEMKETQLLYDGKNSTSALQKRRFAAQIAQLRKDINRHRQSVALLNKQIDIAATDLHNKAIIETAKAAQLPTTEELTDHAVQAEQMLETLSADADMVSSFETVDMPISDEEAAIMAEFDAANEAEVEADPDEVDEENLECESLYTDKFPQNREAYERRRKQALDG